MKKIGMIGGLAWPSTIEYYKGLCTKTNAHYKQMGVTPPYPTPPMVIESVNINETRKLRGRENDEASWERYDSVFREAFQRLREAGADFGFIASNTPHMRLKSIIRGLDFQIISILDVTAEAVQSLRGKRALILGTAMTMKSTAYAEILRQYGIKIFPRLDENRIIEFERLIDVDLYEKTIPEVRERILSLCREFVDREKNDIACLACTELPLAFPEHKDSAIFKVDGMWFVNTTAAHIEAILREVLA
jgi:aspartate racemase